MSANIEITPEAQDKKETETTSAEKTKDLSNLIEQQELIQKKLDEKVPAVKKLEKIFSEDPKLIDFGKIEDTGRAAVINYNLPSSTRFQGRFHIELEVPVSYFHQKNALHIISDKEEAALLKLVSDREARLKAEAEALALRHRQHDAYVSRLNAQYQSALSTFNSQNSSAYSQLNSSKDGIGYQVNALEQTVNNSGNFSKYAVNIFGIILNGEFEHIKNVIAPRVSQIRNTFSGLNPSDPGSYRSQLFSLKSLVNDLINQIPGVNDIRRGFRDDFINYITPLARNVVSKIDTALSVVNSVSFPSPPSAPTILSYEQWDAQGLWRSFPVSIGEITPMDKALGGLPLAMRRIAVNKIFPNFDPKMDVEMVRSALKDPNNADKILMTTIFPNGEKATGRPTDQQIKNWQSQGYKPYLAQSISGEYYIEFIPEMKKEIDPKIVLVMTFAISNFLGDYGAGATVQTFSLLPGEKTKITVNTYTREEKKVADASSIFDSSSESATNSFESSLQKQTGVTASVEAYVNAHTNASAGANIGYASANVETGVEAGVSGSLSTFSNDVANTAQKHAAEKSSKRDVNVSKTSETTSEQSEERGLEREIYNPNLSRVLNFVFRQLNQEYIMITHLIDVRVSFSNNIDEDYLEVPLHELDKLMDRYISPESITIIPDFVPPKPDDPLVKDVRELRKDILDAISKVGEVLARFKNLPTPQQLPTAFFPVAGFATNTRMLEAPFDQIKGVAVLLPENNINYDDYEKNLNTIKGKGEELLRNINQIFPVFTFLGQSNLNVGNREFANAIIPVINGLTAKVNQSLAKITVLKQNQPPSQSISYRSLLKEKILSSLRFIFDYKNRPFNITDQIVDPTNPSKPTGRYRFKRQPYRQYCMEYVNSDEVDFKQKFQDVVNGLDHGVEGIITGIERVILRTDAIIVESLLGQGIALDGFALGMQEQSLTEKMLENERQQIENRRQQAGLDIVALKNLTPEQAKLAADLYYKIFGLTPMKQFAEKTYPVIFPEMKKTVQNLSVE